MNTDSESRLDHHVLTCWGRNRHGRNRLIHQADCCLPGAPSVMDHPLLSFCFVYHRPRCRLGTGHDVHMYMRCVLPKKTSARRFRRWIGIEGFSALTGRTKNVPCCHLLQQHLINTVWLLSPVRPEDDLHLSFCLFAPVQPPHHHPCKLIARAYAKLLLPTIPHGWSWLMRIPFWSMILVLYPQTGRLEPCLQHK